MTDKTVTEKASIELKKDKVRARIKELRNRLVEKHEVTVESIAQELEEARTMALKAFTPQAGAAVAASMGKAKLYGLITDKAEIKQTVEVLTDTQLDAEIKRAAKSAGLRLEIDLENRLIVDGKRSIQDPQNWCREALKYGKWVAWIDSQWLDKKHRCERFRVKAVRH